MQVGNQATRALVLAREAATAAGDEQLSSYHVLLGLADGEGVARHALGLTPHRIREAGSTLAGAAPRFPTGLEVVRAGAVHAGKADRDRVTTADLLLAVLGPESDDGPVALVLRAAGTDPVAVRAALTGTHHTDCCREAGFSPLRPVLAAMGSRTDGLPGRARAVAVAVAALTPFVLAYAAVLAVTWDTAGPELVLTMGLGLLLFLLPASLLSVRRHLRNGTSSATRLVLPGEMQPLLDRLGLRRLEVRVTNEVLHDRCIRFGGRASLIMSSDTEGHPEYAEFVLWHEIAHLAHRDTVSFTLQGLVGASLCFAAVFSFDPRSIPVAMVAVVVASTGIRWWSELACDRLAVRRAGADALHAWAANRRALVASAGRSRALASRMTGLLTHPPLALRTALHPR
ncbi:Clp protease N-terminal domain-containing protein [Catenuloplanes sp. NPDC051500]|uniref:Clp protease N-terminal domain-containing protein n=1 Tax=Catenuloplanes sp. NPDC051500 TaxID=3363959 RepID=UPI00379D29D6